MGNPAVLATFTMVLIGFVNRLLIFALLLVITFYLPRLLPGDPLEVMVASEYTRGLNAGEIQQLRIHMGFEGSWLDQLAAYGFGILHGDLGYSFRHAAPVADIIIQPLGWTLFLILLALPIFLVTGVACGIEAGRQPHGGIDRFLTGAMTLLASLPPFVMAIGLLLVFAILLPILPASGAQPLFPAQGMVAHALQILRHALLPALALAMHEIVRFFFVARSEAISLSTRPFLLNARARGIYGVRERVDYYGRNIFPAIASRLSDAFSGLISGALFVEIVFSYPGIGLVLYKAIGERDYIVIQSTVLLLSVFILGFNWIIDTLVLLHSRRG
ncbi:ABC transporter permease [uncultured Microbulbifer sp.]|uniref:ABC transporter permease n=1 Tax=uncultured Microbulbifer sp. TaxID=348147 RepID=UPI00260211D2|nr:ABC transporter permease [uncultured Microbulbifer sp.]